ncbi:MAG: hypothetical protein KF819_24145 [Labilithrix sp.]|nr:hypothetical protein [Labilithrix sp.]
MRLKVDLARIAAVSAASLALLLACGSETAGGDDGAPDGASAEPEAGLRESAADAPEADALPSGELSCDPAAGCGPGMVCTDVGRPTPFCRAACASDDDCVAVTTACVLLTAGPPASGACVPTCTPFGGGCPGTLTCTAHAPDVAGVTQPPKAAKSAFCRVPGALALGASCVDDPLGCVANAECVFFPQNGEDVDDSKCHALCDAAHACAAGNCVIKPGETFGFCTG